jgi:ferric-dicitrate binding protein FerR (iron transport regulator)
MNFLEYLKTVFSFWRKPKNATTGFDSLLDKGFAQVRNSDPETPQQWLRLQRAVSAQPSEAQSRSVQLVPRLAFVAVIAAVVIVGAYFYFSPEDLAPESYATRRGEQTHLVLHDSSEVTLNSATELIVQKMQGGKFPSPSK